MIKDVSKRNFIKKSCLAGMAMLLSIPDLLSTNKISKTVKNNDNSMENVEVVIIGAGAAGLSAALFLVRARRSMIIYDSNEKRISATPRIHEYIGFEGVTPNEYHSKGAAEIKMYGGEIRNKKVQQVYKTADGFMVYSENEIVFTKSLIIATGLVDVLPDIPGLKEGWGKDIHVCPCFTGYELYNKRLVVFGLQERLGQLSKFLTAWSNDVTVVAKDYFDASTLKKLNARRVKIIYGEVDKIIRKGRRMDYVSTKKGDRVSSDGVFIAAPMRAASDLAASLCEVDEQGFAKTDAMGKTNIEGLWVIGNANNPIAHLAHAVAAGVAVGPVVTDYLIERSIVQAS
jgi:thioredoxin reductase